MDCPKSERLTIPLRKWMHICGVYRANKDMTVYVNGKMMATLPIQGEMTYALGRGAECRIGMVATPGKPSESPDVTGLFDRRNREGQIPASGQAVQHRAPTTEPCRSDSRDRSSVTCAGSANGRPVRA